MTARMLDYALDVAMELSEEQQEMLIEIIRRRQVDARRREIADDAKVTLDAFRKGELKPQSAAAIIRELHEDWDN